MQHRDGGSIIHVPELIRTIVNRVEFVEANIPSGISVKLSNKFRVSKSDFDNSLVAKSTINFLHWSHLASNPFSLPG